MATKKEAETVRLTHSNGAVVNVDADKAERLLSGTGWTKAAARKAAAKSTDNA